MSARPAPTYIDHLPVEHIDHDVDVEAILRRMNRPELGRRCEVRWGLPGRSGTPSRLTVRCRHIAAWAALLTGECCDQWGYVCKKHVAGWSRPGYRLACVHHGLPITVATMVSLRG